MIRKRMTQKLLQCLGLAAMLGLFTGTAQALPVYLQAPTDAHGNITLLTGETATVNLYLSGAGMPAPRSPLTAYGLNLNAGGLTTNLLNGAAGYVASPFGLLGADNEFIWGGNMSSLIFSRDTDGGPLPDVLLASFELVASAVGSFTLDVNGGVYFGEPLAAMFDLASEITVNVVPEPGTLLLMASGLLGLVLWGRRKRALIETA